MKPSKLISLILFICSVTAGGSVFSQEKMYKVGITPTAMPFTFLDPKTNTIQGIMVDIIREISVDAGFKIEPEAMPFSSLIPSLTSSKIDIISAAMFINPKRQEVIDFSRPILTYGEALIVAKGDSREYSKLEELKGKSIGVQKGTLFVEPIQQLGIFSDVKIYDNIPSIIADVQAGRIQVGVADAPIAAYYLQQGSYSNARLVKGYVPVMTGSIGIGVRKGENALLSKLNASIDKLKKNGAIDKIISKWAP